MPGVSARHEEHRHSFAVSRVRIGHHHDDEERRVAGIGCEVFLPVDDPVVAVLHGVRAEQARVGAAVGFGHRKGGEDFAVEKRLQVAPLLVVGAEHGQNLGVAGVGRLAAENDGTPSCSAQDLVDEREFHLTVALTAKLGSEVACPQPLFAHPVLKWAHDLGEFGGQRRVDDVLALIGEVVERLDLVAHERVHPVELRLKLGVGAEVPHVISFLHRL